MRDINTVVLVGRLTRDAELRYTNSGLQILSFSVANNYSKMVGAEWVDEANFFDVTVFGKLAESVSRYMLKGKQVAIDGELRHERWETNEGEKRSKVRIIAKSVQMLGSREERPVAEDPNDVAPWEAPPAPQKEAKQGEFVDDVPF